MRETAVRIDDLRELVAAEPTISNTQIAELYGISTGYVTELCRRAGVVLRRANAAEKPAPSRAYPERMSVKSSRAPQSRSCICCGEGFWSQGPHNRMCGRCRQRSE